MAYVPRLLEEHKTVVNKDLLDHMQDGIAGAYFTTDTTLTLGENQKLSVNMATQQNRALPIKAAEVDIIVGSIATLLETI